MYIYDYNRKGITMKNTTPKTKLTKKSTSITTTGLIKFFMIFFSASFFVSAVYAAVSSGDSWRTSLFHSGRYTDMYMDFFNSIRDAGAEDVYTARNNIYPPLCLLIFKVLGFLVSEDLVDLPNKQRVLLQTDQRCMVIYMLFACILILSLSTLINSYVNKLKWQNNKSQATYHTLLSFMLIISYPVMYCIERGNIIILSMIFTMFFVFFKDSDSKALKEISYISLALAAGIKLYPAIFGLMLLFEKKYKDAARLVVYGIIAVFLPFVFFMQPDTLSISASAYPSLAMISNSNVLASGESNSALANIIENLLSFATNKKSRLNFSSVSIQNFVFIVNPLNTSLAKTICYITEAIAFIALFFTKKKWHHVFLLIYLMLNIPSASSSYALTFLIIPFIMFLYDDKGNGYPHDKRPKIDIIHILCFALLLAPLPALWYYHQDAAKEFFNSFGISYQSRFNQVIAGFVYQFMFFLIIIEVFAGKLMKKSKKCANTDTTDLNQEVA